MKNKKIVLLDNNDSFTYNIVDYLRRIDTIDLSVIETNQLSAVDLNKFDTFIISPGPGLPKDFPALFDVLEKHHASKPILGICLGHQAIGAFYGAKFSPVSPVVHGQAHTVEIIKQSRIFDNVPKNFKAGLYHSWALDRNAFPKELEITAVSENKVIMAVASKKHSVFGIQFHPESYITEYGFTILKNFVELS